MKILIDEEVVKTALDALELTAYLPSTQQVMLNLRSALDAAEKVEPDYRAIADAVVGNLEGRKQVINLDLEEELVEEIMQEMADTTRDGFHPAPAVPFGKSDDIHHLAENIMTDCGCSSHYDALREKIENRLWDYFDSNIPAPTEPGPVGDSAFEQWFQAQPFATHGVKQIARDAYAAGMGENSAHAVPEGWQPRDTMPKDSTKVIVACAKFGIYDTPGELAWEGRGDSKWIPFAWTPRPTDNEIKAILSTAPEVK